MRVPPAEAPLQPLRPGDLVLVPGLAFDRAGRRLGRGGGHYDRALAEAGSEVVAIGVGYAFQLLDEDLPEEAHDRRMAGVLTERGLWRVARA